MRIRSIDPLAFLLPVQSERGRGAYQVTLSVDHDGCVTTARVTNLQPTQLNSESAASTMQIEHIATRVITALTTLRWAGFIRSYSPTEIRWEEEYPKPAMLLRPAPIEWSAELNRYCFVGPKDFWSMSNSQTIFYGN